MKQLPRAFLCLCTLLASIDGILAQGTTFTYQGRLSDGTSAANGRYDFIFTLFGVSSGGNAIAGPVTNSAVGLSNGVFTVTLDFGANFPGVDRWLEIGVRNNGSAGDYQTLSPRQPLTATPYAIRAANFSGAIADNQLSGNVPLLSGGKLPGSALPFNVALRNATNDFTGLNALNDVTLYLRGSGDGHHGLGWYGLGKSFAGTDLDGPALFGWTSGGLGTSQGTEKLALVWNVAGNVGIGTNTPTERLQVNGNVLVNGTLTATAVSGAFTWQVADGTSQLALPNHGYVTTNDTAQVTVALPASPNVGDTVRVSGAGAGGWKIAQNDGQSVLAANLATVFPGANWTSHEPNGFWQSVASSADGTKLVAVVDDTESINSGQIYTSTDSGLTWFLRENDPFGIQSVASSADGTKLVAARDGGSILISRNSGLNWSSRASSRNWSAVASSADGTRLVAVAFGGQIYISTDSGDVWTASETNRDWRAVTSSADGTKLVAAANTAANGGGQIYTSIDSGGSWTPRETNRNWIALASSADGARLVAAANGGQIYTSIDSGGSWTPRESNRNWTAVASSADGTRLVAVASGGQIYTSTDPGVWIPRESNRNWTSVASSADGTKLVAEVVPGRIYTSAAAIGVTTTVGAAGYLIGGQAAAIELQYIGNNQFLPLSYVGIISRF